MDPISISASIGALLTIAVKLITVTHSYGTLVKDFPKELEDLMLELQSLSGILTTLSVVYGQSLPGAPQKPTLTVDPFGGALDACTRCLKSTYESLENHNSGNKLRRVFKRITWPLNEGETKELFNRLGRYKTTFTLAISSYDTTLRRAMYEDIEELKNHEIKKTARKESEKKSLRFREILRWLSSADPETNHIAAREIRQDGSGKWFTEGKAYQDWFLEKSSFLWLHGKPGAGKTVLSSIVIDDAMSEISAGVHASPALIYFYCDFKESSKQTGDSLIASLIAQLIRDMPEVPADLNTLYLEKFDDGRKPPSATHLEECLISIIKRFSKVVAVIDALDECVMEKRDRLCQRLRRLTGQGNINLLVISRDEADIREEFSKLPALMIKDEDVSADISRYVTAEMGRRARLNRLKPSTKSSIVSTLVNEANGMFRWASCCLDDISKLRTDKAIRTALKSLPSTLEQSYERILTNIDERDKTIAIRVFQWLLFSHRPMNLSEITDAIAIELGDTSMDPEGKLNDPEEIPQICGALVRLDQRNMTLGLAHFTVKEYLISAKISQGPAAEYQIRFEIANAELAKTCLTYILFDDFTVGHCRNKAEYDSRIQDYPLLSYAATDWQKHLKAYQTGSDKTLDDLALSFFTLENDHGKFYSWLQVYLSHMHKEREPVYFEREITQQSDTYTTMPWPLHVATQMGQLPAVEEIFKCGADLDMPCSYNDWSGSPLTLAVENNHIDVVRVLLEGGASPNNLKPMRSRPPLEIAARKGFAECTRLLLSYGAEGPGDSGCYEEAVIEALAHGHTEVVGVFLDTDYCKGLIPLANTPCDIYTATFAFLKYGIERGMENVFRQYWNTPWGPDMILDRGLLLGISETAVYREHSKFLRIMMQNEKVKKAFIKDEIFGPVFRQAAYFGRESIMEILFSFRRDVSADIMGIALNFAAAGGHVKVVERLIRAGADPLYVDTEGWSPLLHASEYRGKDVVTFLTEIEGVAESVKLAGLVGPTSWQTTIKRKELEVSADKLGVRNTGTESAATIETVYPILPLKLCNNYSFEVKILENCASGFYISIGFADAPFHRETMWRPQRPPQELILEEVEMYLPEDGDMCCGMTWGYCSNGAVTHGESHRVTGNEYAAQDIVGCHFDGTRDIAIFTLNGEVVGKAFGKVMGKLVPIVTLGPGAHIEANFGDKPFAYPPPQLSPEMIENAWKPLRYMAPGLFEGFKPLV